jgi:hypothetical protein
MVGNRENRTDKYSGLNGDNFSSNITKPRAFHLTQKEWRDLSSDAWREFAGNRPGAAKFIAAAIECSPKTAQSWLDGESTPAGLLDMRAISRNPFYAALKDDVAGRRSEMNPRLKLKLQELRELALELDGGEV